MPLSPRWARVTTCRVRSMSSSSRVTFARAPLLRLDLNQKHGNVLGIGQRGGLICLNE
jgi:hypothetical protein